MESNSDVVLSFLVFVAVGYLLNGFFLAMLKAISKSEEEEEVHNLIRILEIACMVPWATVIILAIVTFVTSTYPDENDIDII